MLRITTVDEAYADIDATVISLDGDSLVCWREPAVEPVARYRLAQVSTVEVAEPEASSVAAPAPPGRGGARADSAFPNAFRRWTEADEQAVISAYHRGDSLDQIATAVGRRVGGVRARLIGLGVIPPEPGDRFRFSSPPVFSPHPDGTVLRPRLHVVGGTGEGAQAEQTPGHAVVGEPAAARSRPASSDGST